MSAAALKACYNTTQYNKSIYNARMVSLRAASDSGLHPPSLPWKQLPTLHSLVALEVGPLPFSPSLAYPYPTPIFRSAC